MEERRGMVTFQGAPLTLLGPALKTGERAPEFTVLDASLNPVSLRDFQGRTKLISAVPSLDTPVCELQTKRFHEAASKLADTIDVLTISMDLPFAQSRFCATHGIEKIRVLSDHRDASFGLAYGILLKELRLLARAVFVLDADDRLRHLEIVREIGEHPDYDAALAALG
jgi:thioredoxin-dependent peroxiredoxin